MCAPVGRATRARTAASVPAPPTAMGVAAVRRDTACATQATLAPPAPPAPAWQTAEAVGAVCRECVCATRAIAARTVGKKSPPPAPALGGVGPGNYAAQASVYVLRATEAQTVPSKRALRTAVAVENVVTAAASAKTAMQGRTVGKVRRQPCPICSVRDWEPEPVGRPEPEA